MLGSAQRSLHAVPVDASAHIEQFQAQLRLQHSEERRLVMITGAIASLCGEAPGYAVELADEALRLATHLHDATCMPLILHGRGVARRALGDLSGGVEDLCEAYEQAVMLDQVERGGESALEVGFALVADGDLAEGLIWFNRALERGQGDLRARALAGLARAHTDLGDLLHGLDYAQQALAIVEALGEEEPVGVVLSTIGVIYSLLEDYEASFAAFEGALRVFRSVGNRYLEVRALTNMGQAHLSRGESAEALDYATTALLIHEELGDAHGMALALLTIGSIHAEQGEISIALEYHSRAYCALEDLSSTPLHVSCLLGISRLHVAVEDFEGARGGAEGGLEIACELGDKGLQAEAHDDLAWLCEKSGDLAGAIEHYKKARDLRMDLAGSARQHDAAALRIRFEAERGERERMRLEARLEALEAELQGKNQELAELALGIMEKNELLEGVRKGIAELLRRTGGATHMLIQELLGAIQSTAEESDAWNSFETQFQQLHQGFLRALSQRFPNLTPTELKICALLRLGMPSKEIAAVLHMSPRTVESHRYWIRKKLGLSAARNLKAFLLGMG